ncbi:Dynein assembly factor 4, axonemal [Frankliniella fusca]|uniref:Dynein assembly factor 4, axonemal n=1 Tax=Frankliniella fusca TaxID=407009 RepID=A0AAE1LJ14_9NEOP|nr:Dynein assembly factor 4, axonemal [Frankliniella fusca]
MGNHPCQWAKPLDRGDFFMDPEPEVTPPASRKRRHPAPVSNSPRKRGRNVDGWKASITKKAYNVGEVHVNWRGKEILAKQIGPGCSIVTCKRQCQDKFLRLKKDRCSQCENWKYKTQAEKSAAGEQEKYDLHIANKKKGEALKKGRLTSKTEADLCVASFDFQKILYRPKGENATYFYRSKFKCFDFTIFDHRTKEGRCYVWDQTIASKGANEAASCLLLFIEEKAKEGIKKIVFYSDNCWSQNKNSKVLSMLNSACVKFGITITHRFLEKGHTHMEVDNVHACIENRSQNLDIFTPGQWYAIIKSAKISDPKYKLIEMEQKSILDFKNLAEHQSWNLGISKLREIVLTENNAYYKHNYEDKPRFIIPLPARPGRPVNLHTFRLKPAYG